MKALVLPLLLLAQQMHTGPYRLPYIVPVAACADIPRGSMSATATVHIVAGSATVVEFGADCKCGDAITSMTDSLGNTWVETSTGIYGSLTWVCGQCIGGDDTIRLTFSEPQGAATQALLGAVNYPDVTTAAPSDGNVGTYQTHDTLLTTPPLTTSHAPDRLVAFGYSSSGHTVWPNTVAGYTTDLTCTYNDVLTDHQSLVVASRVVTSVGIYTQTTTFNAAILPPDEEVASLQGLKQ